MDCGDVGAGGEAIQVRVRGDTTLHAMNPTWPVRFSSSLRVLQIRTKQSGGVVGQKQSMDKSFFVYIMTNPRKTVLYTGVTNNLERRVFEHKNKLAPGFASKYNVTDLVYYEVAETAEAAITREKRLKGGSRRQKIELIKGMNPGWRDLSAEL